MKTWLKAIGDWHQKLEDWAFEDGISTCRILLRSVIFIIVDVLFKLVLFWGISMTVITLVGRFFIKTDEVVEE